VIGEALSDVPEEETRARVLAWAIRLFTESHDARNIVAHETRTPDAAGTSTPPIDIDDALSLEGLETIFTGERVPKRDNPTPPRGLRASPLLTIRFRWPR